MAPSYAEAVSGVKGTVQACLIKDRATFRCEFTLCEGCVVLKVKKKTWVVATGDKVVSEGR